MPRKTVTLLVHVELDDVPGAFHTPESARTTVQIILDGRIGHYKPAVTIHD